MERAAFLSKKALLRPVGSVSEKPHIAQLEKELLEESTSSASVLAVSAARQLPCK
nr:fumarate hydratase [Prevotella intermedia]